MHRSRSLLLTAAILLGALSAPALAEYTIWHSPLPAQVAAFSSSLDIAPGSPAQCLRVTANTPGDLLWVDFPLTLPSDVNVVGVILCYENAAASRYVSQIRLTRMTTPNAATAFHDDATDLTTPSMDCYYSNVGNLAVLGTTTLSLRFHFDAQGEWIEIGGIGIVVEAPASAVDGDFEVDPTIGVALGQNQPNPFAASTTIEYVLDRDEDVSLQIIDVSGRVIRTLAEGRQPTGEYRIQWDGTDDAGLEMTSGKYFYRVQTGGMTESRGMILLR